MPAGNTGGGSGCEQRKEEARKGEKKQENMGKPMVDCVSGDFILLFCQKAEGGNEEEWIIRKRDTS